MYNIAINTFRELFRNRILSLIFLFASMLIGFSLVLATLSLGETRRIVVDFWLAMIELGGLVAVLFVGGQMLFREIEGRTIYLILSKPIRRFQYILGKFFWFWSIIFLLVLLQWCIFLFLIFYSGGMVDPLVFVALLSIFLKLIIVFAIILFFTTFTSPILSIVLTLGIYIAAHGISWVLDVASRSGSVGMIYVSKALLMGLPQFEALNAAKNSIGTPVGIQASFFMWNGVAAIVYLMLILGLACAIFEHKKFENA